MADQWTGMNQPAGGQGMFPPQQPPAGPEAPPPVTGPQPKEDTPLEQPVIYYNKLWRVAPLVVKTQEQQDALDPNEWTQDPGHLPVTAAAGGQKPQYPKLYFNVNVSPRVINDAKEEASLSTDWQEFSLSEALLKSAWANLQAKQAAQAAKDAAKAQPGGGQPPAQQYPQYPQNGYPQQS